MKRFLPDIKKLVSAKDLLPKIVCLLLSVLLWIYVNRTKVGEERFSIPVELRNIPEKLMVLEGTNKTITVTLTGRKDLLKSVNIKDINAWVDLENPDIGISRKYPVNIRKQGLPENIELALTANELSLTVEREVQKKVRIEADIQNKSRDRNIISDVRVDPPYAMISGPESVMMKIESIRTHLITIGNEAGRIERDISIDRESLPDIKIDVNRARVIINTVNASTLEKFDIAIDARNTRDGYNYILSRQSVKVYVRLKEPEETPDSDDIEAFVDMASMRYDYLFKNLNVNNIDKDFIINVMSKDDNMEVVAVIPAAISVKIVRE